MFRNIWDNIAEQFRHGNAIVRLILICISVFLTFEFIRLGFWIAQREQDFEKIYDLFALPISLHTLLHQPWSVFTFMFMHADIQHILWNLLFLYFFGQIYSLYMLNRRVSAIFICGSLVGSILAIAMVHLLPPLHKDIGQYMVGASAGIEAIIFAATALNPDHKVSVILIGMIPIKFIALTFLLMNIVALTYGNAGGMIAHIGGAIFGFTYIKSLQSGVDWFAPLDWVSRLFSRSGRNMKATHVSRGASVTHQERPSSEQKRLDEILDKISKSGYSSLSKEEKDFLFKYSNK